MSLTPNYHQAKSTDVDIPLDDYPSSLEIALNGNTGTLKARHSFSKNDVDSGFLDPDTFRRLSTSTISGLSDDSRIGRPNSYTSDVRFPSRSPAPPRQPWKATLQRFWQRNRGLWLVSISQLFGALMNVTTRLLELEGEGMHPIQVLFCRMILTTSCCCFYMWYTKVPYFPFGMREVRWLLVVRSISGFFGIFGMYYSLLYLPISEATVITFLGPAVAGFGCYIIIGEPFTRVEQIASFISLFGVVLIAHPTSFIHFTSSASPDGSIGGGFIANSTSEATSTEDTGFATPTTSQRLTAIGVALIGVLGGAGALVCIKWIGKRAHPLISVNYFSVWVLMVSTSVLCVSTFTPPGTPFHSDKLQLLLPSSLRQWGLLIFLGACGFLTQFMMTEGLIHEKGNRATNMVYTNMLFALLFDKWIFGTVPDAWSVVGSGLILGSAIYVAMQKGGEENPPANGPEIEVVSPDEEMGMLQDMDDSDSAEDDDEEIERTSEQGNPDDGLSSPLEPDHRTLLP